MQCFGAVKPRVCYEGKRGSWKTSFMQLDQPGALAIRVQEGASWWSLTAYSKRNGDDADLLAIAAFVSFVPFCPTPLLLSMNVMVVIGKSCFSTLALFMRG